jgi:hypothetical protein
LTGLPTVGRKTAGILQSMRASLEEEAAAIMAEIARLEQAAGQVV